MPSASASEVPPARSGDAEAFKKWVNNELRPELEGSMSVKVDITSGTCYAVAFHVEEHEKPSKRDNVFPKKTKDFLHRFSVAGIGMADLYRILHQLKYIDALKVTQAQVNYWVAEIGSSKYGDNEPDQLKSAYNFISREAGLTGDFTLLLFVFEGTDEFFSRNVMSADMDPWFKVQSEETLSILTGEERPGSEEVIPSSDSVPVVLDSDNVTRSDGDEDTGEELTVETSISEERPGSEEVIPSSDSVPVVLDCDNVTRSDGDEDTGEELTFETSISILQLTFVDIKEKIDLGGLNVPQCIGIVRSVDSIERVRVVSMAVDYGGSGGEERLFSEEASKSHIRLITDYKSNEMMAAMEDAWRIHNPEEVNRKGVPKPGSYNEFSLTFVKLMYAKVNLAAKLILNAPHRLAQLLANEAAMRVQARSLRLL
ncbi:hypothetical protein R1sor_019833 [Riccia sorocarpa]|uniref:Uncharacterized protein n=1 Tax=Riccia sorocarpa TaxID=122646 RepID=A0ABD3IEA4_9MARC